MWTKRPGNSMVLFSIARSPRLRSMTNFFLANLAMADFCVGAFCVLPNLSTFLSPNWILGKAMCKVYYYIWNVSYTASIIILTVIAVERYIAIIHPLRARHLLTPRKLKLTQAAIWIVAFLYNIPYLFFYDTFSFTDYDKVFCYSRNEHLTNLKMLSLANFIIWYIIPLSLIGFMYYRVAFTLWKTTVVAALRLQNYSTVDSDSFRSNNSTKIIELNHESRALKCRSASLDEADLTDRNRSGSSRESPSSDQSVRNQNKQTILIVCGVGKRDFVCPHETSPPSSGNDNEDGIRMNEMGHGNRSSIKGTCMQQRFKYRKTLNSSSRRVCRARKKVVKLLVLVVIAFGVCVLPHMMKVLNHYWLLIKVPHNIDLILSPLSFLVLYLNSGLNPILYALFSNNFRRSFKESLRCFRQRPSREIKY